jgi:hypothetical protein
MKLQNSVKRTLDAEDVSAGYMGVAFGGAQTGVAEKALDIADVGTVFEKMGGEGVTQSVNRSFFDCMRGVRSTLRQIHYPNNNPWVVDNSGAGSGFLKNPLGGTD